MGTLAGIALIGLASAVLYVGSHILFDKGNNH
jgi:hypothetical protein